MMSNSPSSLQTRQGLHRRQNSTPVAFEAMKVQHPTTIQKQNSPHKRGQSYDSRSPIRRQPTRAGSTVSVTNIGSTPNGQQILREAQQQRLARPGQIHPNELSVSAQCGTYQPMSNSSLQGSPFDHMTMNAVMQNLQGIPPHSQLLPQDLGIPVSASMPMGFGLDENNQHYFQHAHAVPMDMGMIPSTDRRMSHPELRIHTGSRPYTPTQQSQIAQFPLTPATTPFRHQAQFAQLSQVAALQFVQDDKIRAPYPVSMQKSRSLQGIVERNENDFSIGNFETADMQTRRSATRHQSIERRFSPVPSSKDEKTNASSTKDLPVEEPLPFFDENGGPVSSLDDQPVPVLASSLPAGSQSPTRPALSPRRMSISDLNLDPGISASIEETNVTLDDIAQFIEGPDPLDNKWICKYEDCNKRFGRKENIKSHVQTHLGDRQFKCNHCDKCFVRGHDLKRHAKIHTGNKPYPCLCGNAFARHDALTRHRQRGMCIGAFDGIVKKVIKRGRPRKHRPEMDERLDKSSRTRRNKANSENGYDAFESSASSCSMSSWGSPPTDTMDNLSLRGQSPYDELNLFGLQPTHHTIEQVSFPPDIFSFTPPASPGYSTGNKPSPSYRELTPSEIASIAGDMTHPIVTTAGNMPAINELSSTDLSRNVLAANPMTIQHSQQSLPGLSHSSSSPAADIAAFDFGSDDPTMSSMTSMDMGMTGKLDVLSHERNEFDSFLDYGGIEMGLESTNADTFFAI